MTTLTLRIAALAGIAIALIVAACAGDGAGNEKPTLAAPDTSRTVDPLALCFDASAFPEGFALESELVLDNAASVERHAGDDPQRVAELARLYEEWRRITGAQRSFLPSSEFESATCTVELYQDAGGASQAFAEWGYQQRPLLGEQEQGTFSELASPAVGAESRQYLSLHAVVWGSTVIFRTENVLGRVDIGARSGSFSEGELTESFSGEGLADHAATLAQVVLERIERDLAASE